MSKRAKTGGASKAVPLPLSDFDEARGRWRSEVQAELGQAADPKNRSGIEVKSIYTPQDWPGSPQGADYMQALGLSKDELVQALGLSFTVSTLALAGGLLWRGALGGGELSASLLALIPAGLGMWLGQWLRQRISALLFKRVFFIGLGLLGGHLLISG